MCSIVNASNWQLVGMPQQGLVLGLAREHMGGTGSGHVPMLGP